MAVCLMDSLVLSIKPSTGEHAHWYALTRKHSRVQLRLSSLANMLSYIGLLAALVAVPIAAQNVTVADIQGASWLSPYNGQTVRNLTGVVTAKVRPAPDLHSAHSADMKHTQGPSGLWISGAPSDDPRVSNGLYVFGSAILNRTAVGDLISLSGRVSDYRASTAARLNDLYATELTSPTALVVLSQNNTVTPRVLGGALSPPTQALSALDNDAGADGWLELPNNQSSITHANATLEPAKYGLDFWASLEGQLVTVKSPVAMNFENQYGEFWVYGGDWAVTGKNVRGGLTMTFGEQQDMFLVTDPHTDTDEGPDGIPDANPESIIVGGPLDGTKNPTTSLGMTFTDITGVVNYQCVTSRLYVASVF